VPNNALKLFKGAKFEEDFNLRPLLRKLEPISKPNKGFLREIITGT